MKAGSLPHRDQTKGPLSAPHDDSCLTMNTVPVAHGKSQHCSSPLHHTDLVKNTTCIRTSFVQHRLLPKAHRFSPEHISTLHSKPLPTAQSPHVCSTNWTPGWWSSWETDLPHITLTLARPCSLVRNTQTLVTSWEPSPKDTDCPHHNSIP